MAIEGHTFTEGQITEVLENTKVLGTEKELLEVQNAIKLYEAIDEFKSNRFNDFLRAHKILMSGLLVTVGKYLSKNVGVLAGADTERV